MFGAGTAWVLLAASARLEPPAIPSAFVCNHVIEGLYGQMLSMANGGSAFRWATRLMGIESRSLPELDALAERIPPGCGGVRFWPLLVAATPAGLPPGTAGRLTGLQLAHTGGHVLRAVVEGLAMELARYLGLLRRGGVPAKRLLMCGGATASRVTPQIIADVTGLPVVCSRESEMSALGAAMLARGLVEPTRGLAEISRAMAPPVRTFRPGPHAALYRRQLKEYVSSLPAL
jgi:xylulokinase